MALANKGIFNGNRKFTFKDFNISDEQEEIIKRTIAEKKAILVVGSTGSGKTQLLNACLREIPKSDRMLSNEDAFEMDFSHLDDCLQTTSNPLMATATEGMLTTQTLIDDFGRLKPDRITMGELNSMNSVFMLQHLNSGHGGVMTTIHADSVDRGVEKLVQNIMGVNKQDPDFILGSLKEALGLIIFVKRNKITYKREVQELLYGADLKNYQLPSSNQISGAEFNKLVANLNNLFEENLDLKKFLRN